MVFKEDYRNLGAVGMFNSNDKDDDILHHELQERLRKTLYYSRMPSMERPSLAMTELAVKHFRGAATRELGKVDPEWAASFERNAVVSPCAMMLGMIYIERLRTKNPSYLTNVSSQDLFLIAMMVASKYLYDEGIDEEVYNDEWAESGDQEVADVNELEREFLNAIGWNLYVSPVEFWDKLGTMERRIAYDKGSDRGWFTYTDIEVLSKTQHMSTAFGSLLMEVCKVFMACSMAYALSTVTLVTSTLTLSSLQPTANSNHTQLAPTSAPISGQVGLPPVLQESWVGLDEVASDNITDEDDDSKLAGIVSHIMMNMYNGAVDNVDQTGTKVEKPPDDTLGILNTETTSRDQIDHHFQFNVDFSQRITTLGWLSYLRSGVGLPSFLALTLIKDTATEFLKTATFANSHKSTSHKIVAMDTSCYGDDVTDDDNTVLEREYGHCSCFNLTDDNMKVEENKQEPWYWTTAQCTCRANSPNVVTSLRGSSASPPHGSSISQMDVSHCCCRLEKDESVNRYSLFGGLHSVHQPILAPG